MSQNQSDLETFVREYRLRRQVRALESIVDVSQEDPSLYQAAVASLRPEQREKWFAFLERCKQILEVSDG